MTPIAGLILTPVHVWTVVLVVRAGGVENDTQHEGEGDGHKGHSQGTWHIKEQWQIERFFRATKSFLEIRPIYHRKTDRIRAHVFVCVLSLLLSRLIEKKTGITVSEATRILSYLKVTPVPLESGIVMIRSESEPALNLLCKMNIPYSEKILGGAPTKKATKYHLSMHSHKN